MKLETLRSLLRVWWNNRLHIPQACKNNKHFTTTKHTKEGTKGGTKLVSVLDLVEALVVVCTNGSQHAIPEKEVEAIIAFEVLVMLVMVHRCIDPLTNSSALKAFRIQFISQMPIHIVHDHEQEEDHQVRCMDGYGEHEYYQNAYLHQSLQRMKCISSPG